VGLTGVISKIVAVASLVLLPLSVSLWYTSHRYPQHRRYDVTLYKSLRVRMQDGKCGLSLLSMPTKTASRSEFATTSTREPPQMARLFLFASHESGAYRITWLVFPFWMITAGLFLSGTIPLFRGPLRRWYRRRRGHCIHCGYNLTRNRSGRCPECGMRTR